MGRDLATLLFGTVVDGSLYALIGVGFVILFRSTGAINFAQGAIMALGGFVFLAYLQAGLPWVPALVAVCLTLCLLGALLYTLIFRKLIGESLFSLVIATLGLNTVLTALMMIIWGPEIRAIETPFANGTLVTWSGVPFKQLDLYAVVIAAVLVGALALLLRGSRIGTHMRAVAGSSLLAGLSRINVHRMSALAWAISCGLTAAAGVCFALRSTIDPISAQGFGLVAFAAVLLGGLDSLTGAVVGGMALAGVQTLAVLTLGGSWSEVVAYLVLMLLLFTRPQGMFGSPSVARL
ncbi:branched-chain amino acid ABC transporter permease [Streptosporangium sp. NPDC006013]|uniref:branched-chain amino acid ABC transporter permease n=1 Tax=Streptosporangium sp. NPDC006013 TaxID=3155596 RepID=UPI0033A29F44